MKETTSFQNRLDGSNESIKVTHNKAMQTASQTTESPATAKKRLGLFAILAVGVDAAASFLKSKMEKEAAVASQVGAAVLKSKKTASAAVDAVLVRIRPEPPKKARFPSIPLFALLTAFFLASPNCMAGFRGIWAPYFKEEVYVKPNNQAEWQHHRTYNSVYCPPSWGTNWNMKGVATSERRKGSPSFYAISTCHLSDGGHITAYFWRDKNNRLRGRRTTVYNPVELTDHRKVGKITFIEEEGTSQVFLGRPAKYVETWKNRVYKPYAQKVDDYQVTLRTFFRATNDRLEENDEGHTGTCESSQIKYYGPEIALTPCVPSNMSMPSNGYLTFYFYSVVVHDSSDDDDE